MTVFTKDWSNWDLSMIKSIQITPHDSLQYPFNIPAFSTPRVLDFNSPITILVGDNGSGKSTLLKAIAYYNNSINVSKNDINSAYYNDVKEFSKHMRITYDTKTRSGFFFSGEEFITFINHLKNMKEQLQQDYNEVKEEFKHKSEYVRGLALGPIAGQLHDLETKYQGELNKRSHGEGFLAFFKARMHQQGIYLLDEPETPLSTINQYQLLVMITDLTRSGSQVIIATHSPILMALPHAKIYHFSDDGVSPIQYQDIESVQFMKHFLNDPDNFIRRI